MSWRCPAGSGQLRESSAVRTTLRAAEEEEEEQEQQQEEEEEQEQEEEEEEEQQQEQEQEQQEQQQQQQQQQQQPAQQQRHEQQPTATTATATAGWGRWMSNNRALSLSGRSKRAPVSRESALRCACKKRLVTGFHDQQAAGSRESQVP